MSRREDLLGLEAVQLAVAVAGRETLREPAAVRDCEQLRPATDRERRQRALACAVEQCQLPGIRLELGSVDVLRVDAIAHRIDVAAAGDEEPVSEFEQLIDLLSSISWRSRRDQGQATGGGDPLGIRRVERFEARPLAEVGRERPAPAGDQDARSVQLHRCEYIMRALRPTGAL